MYDWMITYISQELRNHFKHALPCNLLFILQTTHGMDRLLELCLSLTIAIDPLYKVTNLTNNRSIIQIYPIDPSYKPTQLIHHTNLPNWSVIQIYPTDPSYKSTQLIHHTNLPNWSIIQTYPIIDSSYKPTQ